MKGIDLNGVPETMLWPLWNRAAATRRSPKFLTDPMAVELVETLDYDFAATFGRPTKPHAIRARYGDDLIRAHLAKHPDAAVVALGEGLETQFWRLGRPDVPWLSVDVAEAIEVRRRLLPIEDRNILIAASALDPAWMDGLPASESAPFISAAGLLMYFAENDVRDLLKRIASRFAGARLFFDTTPPMFSQRTLREFKVTSRYTAPPMPWGISANEIPYFLDNCGWQVDRAQTFADPYPTEMRLFHLLGKIPPVRDLFAPCLVTCTAK